MSLTFPLPPGEEGAHCSCNGKVRVFRAEKVLQLHQKTLTLPPTAGPTLSRREREYGINPTTTPPKGGVWARILRMRLYKCVFAAPDAARRRHGGILRYAATMAVLVFVLCNAKAAMATNYECDTTQEDLWGGDKLVPQKNDVNGYNGTQSVILFNDETGNFSISVNPYKSIDPHKEAPFNSLPFKILEKTYHQKYHTGYTLLAADITNDDTDTNAGSFFRLQGRDKDSKVVFLLYIASLNRVSTGKCQTYDKIPPVMKDYGVRTPRERL